MDDVGVAVRTGRRPHDIGRSQPRQNDSRRIDIGQADHDWRTRGRPHPVWVIGGGALLLIKLLNLPISNSGPWQAFAGGILALAQ